MKLLRSARFPAILLLVAAVAGLLVANSPIGPAVLEFSHVHLGIPGTDIDLSLTHWVSDGLLVFFFFVVSVELQYAARAAVGPAGREYGLRVALATAASTAAAQALHPGHWYWLPATAAFLVKPDLGPLVSRTLNRVLGTVVGAGVFGLLAPALPGTLWPVAVVAAMGALIPLSLRHFALQTGVITVLVLTLVSLGGEAGLVGSRIVDTLLACALVLLVGHVPIPGHHGGGVALRRSRAERAAGEYLRHVLAGAGTDPAARGRLRRAAYRELAVARASVELAAAELPSHARPAVAAAPVLRELERLVDTATAAAVELDHGEGELSSRHRTELERLLRGLPPTG